MMRLASQLVVFSLLTSAATAYAECAWVSWMFRASDSHQDMLGAYPTHAECLRALRSNTRDMYAKMPRTAVLDNDAGATVVRDDKFLFVFSCWPDTVDPRGPKGK